MSAPVLGDPCWGCRAPSTYAVSNPAVRLMEPLATCSDHLGDLLGNAAKAALRVPAASVTLHVETLVAPRQCECHAHREERRKASTG